MIHKGKIPDGEIVNTLRLDNSLITIEEIINLIKDICNKPWPSYEEADRTSIYTRIWNLLEKHRRTDI